MRDGECAWFCVCVGMYVRLCVMLGSGLYVNHLGNGIIVCENTEGGEPFAHSPIEWIHMQLYIH